MCARSLLTVTYNENQHQPMRTGKCLDITWLPHIILRMYLVLGQSFKLNMRNKKGSYNRKNFKMLFKPILTWNDFSNLSIGITVKQLSRSKRLTVIASLSSEIMPMWFWFIKKLSIDKMTAKHSHKKRAWF